MKDFDWNVSETLYDFDGPKIFTIRNEQGLFLVYFCDDDTAHKIERFIVVPTDDREIEELKLCHKDVFSVLSKDELWLVDSYYVPADGQSLKLFSPKMAYSELESDYLPKPGVFLYPWKCSGLKDYPDYDLVKETNFYSFCSSSSES